MQGVNKSRLFVASCFALLTTALAFALRAGIMNDLADNMSLNDKQLGWIQAMGTFGFPIATLIGGALYNTIGPKKLGYLAFVTHILGITFSILSKSYMPLFISTFFISFGNGIVEAAFNPMIATMYEDKKATMLNRFHVWFPGGLAIGAILAFLFTNIGLGWQAKLAIMYLPAIAYFLLFWGQKFPEIEKSENTSIVHNIKAMFTSPIYLLMLGMMALTATTELGTQGWVERILGKSGAEPLLILAFITIIMAVGRFYAGSIIKKLNITGVLLGSAIITALAVYLMSIATGPMVWVAAVIFAIGVCYFWPNMISFVAVYQPKTGAIGMSVIGGVGMLGLTIFNPIIGKWLSNNKATLAETGLIGDELELAAGQATLQNIAILPIILIVGFLIVYMWQKRQSVPDSSNAH